MGWLSCCTGAVTWCDDRDRFTVGFSSFAGPSAGSASGPQPEPRRCLTANTTSSTALVPTAPVFTATERLALAGFLAGYSGLTSQADIRTGSAAVRQLVPTADRTSHYTRYYTGAAISTASRGTSIRKATICRTKTSDEMSVPRPCALRPHPARHLPQRPRPHQRRLQPALRLADQRQGPAVRPQAPRRPAGPLPLPRPAHPLTAPGRSSPRRRRWPQPAAGVELSRYASKHEPGMVRDAYLYTAHGHAAEHERRAVRGAVRF